MDIAQYISDLLNEHQEVSLPGLGTFMIKNVPSALNKDDGIFYPPSFKISYKSEESSPSVLVRHIVSIKHISESSAEYFIERFCENIESSIKSGNSADLHPLGTLTKAKEGYSFSPSADWESTGFFGLPEVAEVPLISKKNKNIGYSDEGGIVTDEILSDEETPVSSNTRGLWITVLIALLIALGAGLAYFYYSGYYQKSKTKTTGKPSSKAIPPVITRDTVKDSVSFADSIVNELEKQGMHGSQIEKTPDTLTITSKVSSPDTIKTNFKPTRVYEIIVASFGLKGEAERSVRAFQKRGIDAKVVVDTRKPKYKVSIGTFTTSSSAHKENSRVKKELAKDSWVLAIDNQN